MKVRPEDKDVHCSIVEKLRKREGRREREELLKLPYWSGMGPLHSVMERSYSGILCSSFSHDAALHALMRKAL